MREEMLQSCWEQIPGYDSDGEACDFSESLGGKFGAYIVTIINYSESS